jgi:hypothetical protein
MNTRALFLTLATSLVAVPAAAQTPLSELLVKALLADVVLAPPTGPFASHEAHFQPITNGEVASGFGVNQLEIPLAMNATIVSQLSTIPLGSSSGGFSYTFDPALGTFSRQSASFGSAFAERALTAGRGRFNAGFNFQRSTYDTLEGQDLQDGDVHVYLVHQDITPDNSSNGVPAPFFEGDLVGNTLRLNLTSSVATGFLNYGFTDRLDIGITVPFVTISMRTDITARVIRQSTADAPTIHSFDGAGATSKTYTERGRAQGLGDIILRGKYRFLDAARGGLAAGIDLRLPTGDSAELLGAGHLQAKALLIGSMAAGPFSPHLNIGYAFSTGGATSEAGVEILPELPDEFSYTTGFDIAAGNRATVSLDILGRTLRKLGRLVPVNRQFVFSDRNGVVGTSSFEEFARRPGDLSLLTSAIGVRFMPRSNLLVSVQMLVPLTKNGLRDVFTPVVGFDYSF